MFEIIQGSLFGNDKRIVINLNYVVSLNIDDRKVNVLGNSGSFTWTTYTLDEEQFDKLLNIMYEKFGIYY